MTIADSTNEVPVHSDIDFPRDEQLESRLRGLAFRQWLICRAITPLRFCLGSRLEQAFGIITYHRVARQAPNDVGLLNVTPERFELQMQQLIAMGYEGWSLRRVIQHRQEQLSVPRNVFVVVFDDGYSNVYENAFPIMLRLNIPATVFLATAYLDSDAPFPFDNWTTTSIADVPPESWRPLTTDQCLEMRASGLIDLGSHTHTHRDFRRREDEFARDLESSMDLLSNRFELGDATFSFPYGFSNPRMIEISRRQGLLCGLSAECQLVTPNTDPFHWGRFGATELDNGATLAAKLDGWYSTLRSGWRSLRGRTRV